MVYRRYAGLFFIQCTTPATSPLASLESIHLFVETLDEYFGNVCELDLVFNFWKVYQVVDEVFLGGEWEEGSKRAVLARLAQLDKFE